MPTSQADSTGLPRPIGWATLLAAVAIASAIGIQAIEVEQHRSETRSSAPALQVGRADMQAQLISRFRAAIHAVSPEGSPSLAQIVNATEPWQTGPLAQRVARAIVLSTCDDSQQAVAQYEQAAEEAKGIEGDDRRDADSLLRATAEILRSAGAPSVSIDSSSPASREDLEIASTRLGFVLVLGRGIAGVDERDRAEVGTVGMRVAVLGVILMAWLGTALLAGAVALVTGVVLLCLRMLRSGTGAGVPESAVLLEVFAIFIVLLLGLSALLDWSSEWVPGFDELMRRHRSLGTIVSIALEIGAAGAALAWWRFRGGSWRSLRSIAGLERRGGTWRTIGLGFLGYAVALAMGAAGLIVTTVLSRLLEEERLGDPRHPVHEVLMSGEPAAVWTVLLLGVVLAPVIEEIFFRGVLYRGLRDRVGRSGAALAAGGTGALIVSSSIFGIIHPQGLLFAPVLAGLGAGFCIMREWTGSVVPGAIGHAINNGVMLGFVVVLTR